MFRNVLLFTILLVGYVFLSCEEPKDEDNYVMFSKTFGGSQDDWGRSVQQTADGGFIITGETRSFVIEQVDVRLIKTDAQGNEEWNRTFGGSSLNYGNSVQQTFDGGFIITGDTYSLASEKGEAWLMKTDSQGNKEWSKSFGSSSGGSGRAVQQTADGGFIIAGNTSSNYEWFDVLLIKTDSQGNEEWIRTFGGSHGDWGRSVQQTIDGGFIIIGFTRSFASSTIDFWLIKTDAQGNEEWNRTFGGSQGEWGSSVQQTVDGGFIITGETRSFAIGQVDVWLIKTDAQGNEEWNRTFGGSSVDYGESVQQTIDGGFIIAGTTDSFGNGNRDVWLIKTDSQGNEEWIQTFGGSSRDIGRSVQQTTDGGFIIAGTTDSFGNGKSDIWLIKTDPYGNTVPPEE